MPKVQSPLNSARTHMLKPLKTYLHHYDGYARMRPLTGIHVSLRILNLVAKDINVYLFAFRDSIAQSFPK